MYSPERDEMEQLPEEERRVSLFDDHQEEMVVSDDRLFYKHSKMKIRFKPIDIEQPLKLLRARQVSLETSMVQTPKT